MTRLAIVDLETGSQPFYNEDRSIVTIFNGEIFNHADLRNNNLHLHDFKSDHADGEIIPHLYEENALEFANLLDGMFAIALWDSEQKNLVLCRDHFGIKPLYYTICQDTIFFASEIKALLELPNLIPEIDFGQLNNYFISGHTFAPDTIYSNIKQIMPAQILKFDETGKLSIRDYWVPVAKESGRQNVESTLREKLVESVRRRMEADVEVGCFLSGGVDSSIIALLASDFGRKKIRTYSLVYPPSTRMGKSADAHWAKFMSEKINSTHTEILMTPDKVINEFTKIVSAFNEPFAGVSSTYFLSKFVATEVKVALTGDGSDEMFGSYFFHRLSAGLDTQSSDISNRYKLGLSVPEIEELSKIDNEPSRRIKYLKQQGLLPEPYYSELLNNKLLQAGGKSEDLILKQYRKLMIGNESTSKLKQSLWLDFHDLLPNEILPFVDRLSMANSLELRPPFLTKDIYELSLGISPEKLISSETEKEILKKAFLNDLPTELLYREKEGFVLPLAQWLTNEMRPWLLEILTEERIREHGLLNGPDIAKLARDYKEPDHKVAKLLWKFVFFQIWWESHARR
jgi:asparagine synthase (glutamine-hydrolysing)